MAELNPLPDAPFKAGYSFDGWFTNSGKTISAVAGASISENTTLYAKWTKVYATTKDFTTSKTQGTIPNQKTITTSYAAYTPFRVDNFFFGSTDKLCFETGNASDKYNGWKFQYSGATIQFYVENNSEVAVALGANAGCSIKYTPIGSSETTENLSTTDNQTTTKDVAAGTMVTLTTTSGSTVTLKSITITDKASCSAPAAPTISGTTSYTYGGTITLTASHNGDNHDASTTYRWLKGATFAGASQVQAAATGSSGYTFTKTAAMSDAGTYWCEASNGTGCEAHNSSGYAITVAKASISPSLSYSTTSLITGDNSSTPTVSGNTGSGSVSYAVTSASPAGCITVNGTTGVVTAVAAGSGTVTATIAATDNYLGNTCTANFTVTDPCFYADDLKKSSDFTLAAGGTLDASKVSGSVTGGAITNSSASSSITGNDKYGLIIDSESKKVTVTLTSPSIFEAGTVITIGAHVSDQATSGTSKTSGFTVGGNTPTPASKTSETKAEAFTQTYTVVADDGIEGTNHFEIALKSSADKTYIRSIKVTGCGESTAHTITGAVNTEGYGTVSPSSISVEDGSAISISDNVLTCDGNTLTATATSATAEYTYAFSSWSGVTHGASVTTDLTATANFTRTANSYTLTWDLAGGTVTTAGTGAAVDATGTPSSSVAYNTSLTAPVVTKSGYDFSSWSPSVASKMPAANTTYTAQWAERFTVSYDAMGGSVDPTSATGSTASKVTLPTPTHDDYTFDGWYTSAGTKIGDGGEKYGPTAAITLYAKWKGDCAGSGSGISVRFTSSNKNDAGNAFADMSTSSNTTQMVGSGTAKLIAINSAGLYATTNKDGYRSDSRMEMVFYFSSTSTLDVYVGVNSTGREYGLYSFSPADDDHDELSEIVTSDYATCSIVTSNVSAAGTAFAHTASGTPSLSSGLTSFTKAGGAKISYTSLSGFYVFKANGTSDAYVCGFDINGGSATCYTVTYDGNGADGGYTNDPTAYDDENNDVTVLANGFTRTGYAFTHWEDESGNEYKPGDVIENIDDDITLTAQWAAIKYFTNGASTGLWNNSSNWSPSGVPAITDPVVIQANVTVDTDEAKALSVDIESGNTLTIAAGKALIIEKTLTKAGGATAAADVIINSTRAAGTGALIIGGETGSNKATVNFQTKVKRDDGAWINQFIGSPFSDLEPYVDYALQIYKFMPAGGGNRGFWHKLSSGNEMEAFWGYNVLYNDNEFLDVTWTGTLNASSNNVTKTGSNAVQTDNLFANSWVAPIHIAEFEEDDFTNFDPTIYIFNAGTPQQENAAGGIGSGSASASDPGTYAVLPIDAAPWVGMEVIPAMQAFFVKATGASPSIKLDYSKLVYTPALTSVDITPTRSPKRATASEAPEVIRLHVAGENGWAETTYLLGREDFTEGYDRGWDGRYMEGEDTNPQLYAPTSDGNMAVNCVPQIEGTLLGFRKGNADSQYTFTFEYAGDEDYYLKDLKLDIETPIDGEHSYAFTAEAGDNVSRFIIVRKTPTITTGTAGIESEISGARKVIYNNKVYIIRGGSIYSVDGQVIK